MNLKYRYFCAWPIAYKLLNVSVLWHSTDRWVDLARAPVCFRTLLCTQRIVSDIHVSRMATQSQSLRFYWMLNSSVGHQDQPDRCLWIQATKPRLASVLLGDWLVCEPGRRMSAVPGDPPSEMRSRCAVPERCASPDPSALAIPLSSRACLHRATVILAARKRKDRGRAERATVAQRKNRLFHKWLKQLIGPRNPGEKRWSPIFLPENLTITGNEIESRSRIHQYFIRHRGAQGG